MAFSSRFQNIYILKLVSIIRKKINKIEIHELKTSYIELK